ncbi:MAG: retropepsin-like aspartic protease family protein [Janthinobacterium lividum]
MTHQARPEQALARLNRALPGLRVAGGRELVDALYCITYDQVLVGRYDKAARAANELIAHHLPLLDGATRQEVQDDAEIWRALADSPPMTASLNGPVHLPMGRSMVGHYTVTASANGIPLDWVFDTGANLTVLNASTAKRVGIKVVDGLAHTMAGTTGIENVIHVGVLKDLAIGSAILHDVPVLILDDGALTISTPKGKYVISAAVGYPVMRALRTIAFSGAGGFIANDPSIVPRSKGASLGLAALTPTASLEYRGKPIEVSVDTGAQSTTMTSRFSELVRADQIDEKAVQIATGGAGGFRNRRGTVLKDIEFKVGSQSARLNDLKVFYDATETTLDMQYGNVGQDLWRDYDGPIFDFVHGLFYLK